MIFLTQLTFTRDSGCGYLETKCTRIYPASGSNFNFLGGNIALQRPSDNY